MIYLQGPELFLLPYSLFTSVLISSCSILLANIWVRIVSRVSRIGSSINAAWMRRLFHSRIRARSFFVRPISGLIYHSCVSSGYSLASICLFASTSIWRNSIKHCFSSCHLAYHITLCRQAILSLMWYKTTCGTMLKKLFIVELNGNILLISCLKFPWELEGLRRVHLNIDLSLCSINLANFPKSITNRF